MKIFCKYIGGRTFQFTVIPLIVLVWFIFTDPSHGADTLLRVQLWAQAFLVTGLSYLIAKAMLGKASSHALYEAALVSSNIAAGIAYVGVCILRGVVLWSLLSFFASVQQ